MRLLLCIFYLLWLSAVQAEGHSDAAANTELRIRKLENTLNSLDPFLLLNEIESLKRQQNVLQGEIEILQHQIKRQNAQITQLKSTLKTIDSRTSNLQTNSADNETTNSPSTTETNSDRQNIDEPVNASTDDGIIIESTTNSSGKEQYQAAFNLLKESRYQDSIGAFEQFIHNYPDSNYADKAQYWIAETYYIQQDYNNAISAYQKHIEQYTNSPKRSQSKLKLAYSNLEIGERNTAENLLEQILDEFPGSTAARAATKKLRDISVEQQSAQ